MLKLADNDEWLKKTEKAFSDELTYIRDNAERLLKELEVKATAQIAENGILANRSISVFYKQLIDTFDITDQKIDSMVSANEGFVKSIDEHSVPIISNALQIAISPIISRLEKATSDYNESTKTIKRLAVCLGVSVAVTLMALGGIAYMIIEKMC